MSLSTHSISLRGEASRDNSAADTTALLGRVLITAIFLLSGASKITAPSETMTMIQSIGLPFAALGLAIAVLVEVVGSLLLIAGFQTRWVAGGMFLYTLVTAVAFHHAFGDQDQFLHFLKNVAMAGGLLQIVAFGGGRFSLDAWTTTNA